MVRVVPDGPAMLDQQRLGGLVGHADPLGEGQRDGPLLDHPDPVMPQSGGLGRPQKCFPLTVGAGRDGSGGGVLEDQDRVLGRFPQHGVHIFEV